MNLNDAKTAFMTHLEALGKHPRTCYTYSKDLDYLIGFFGGERAIESIRLPEVGKWLKSESYLNTPKGKPRGERTLNKNLRVVRQLFVWAKAAGHVETLPLPKVISLGRDKASEEASEPLVAEDAEVSTGEREE